MENKQVHNFHIPVMGIGFTIDTPIKVARYGISSVMSIIEDDLIEKMRKHYADLWSLEYLEISIHEDDYRAKRITAYLDLVNDIVKKQIQHLRDLEINSDELKAYYDILPDGHLYKEMYQKIGELDNEEARHVETFLKNNIEPGSIDVNIMTKVDKPKMNKKGEMMDPEFSDALSALRGYALSDLNSSIVFSAGFNPKVYGYCASFPDFFPDNNGDLKKKIILKVSDFRSAMIQGKYLAKKGLWISEFRIESGLNCGGHAFATEGLLMGPILEEFKEKRDELYIELFGLCQDALAQSGKTGFLYRPELRITAQGGIGTASENEFLISNYKLDSTGWGSPFLLVPEVTNVDKITLNRLANAKQEDFYLSNASPLGVPFNNFKDSSAEKLRLKRIENGSPGSPCYMKYLQSNTEFTKTPICTASMQYQKLKLKQLKETCANEDEYDLKAANVMEKECLCSGLSESALMLNDIKEKKTFGVVSVCPGPNLAYFSGIFTLKEMVDHIYGRINILNKVYRPNLFINELKLYVTYLIKETQNQTIETVNKKASNLLKFKENLLEGIAYYKNMALKFEKDAKELFSGMIDELKGIENQLTKIEPAH